MSSVSGGAYSGQCMGTVANFERSTANRSRIFCPIFWRIDYHSVCAMGWLQPPIPIQILSMTGFQER
jgi:hypothetical protein